MKYLAIVLVAVLALVVLVGGALEKLSDNAVAIEQARRDIELARTARPAIAGNAIVSVISTGALALILLVIVLGAALALFARFYNRSHPTQRIGVGGGKWASGPNANWGRIGDAPRREQLPAGDRLDRLIRLKELELLERLAGDGSAKLPAQVQQYDDDIVWPG